MSESIRTLNLPARAYNALTRRGIETIEDLCELSAEQISLFTNVGPTTLAVIETALAARGLALTVRTPADEQKRRERERSQHAEQISDWELNKFRDACEAEMIYDEAARRSNEALWQIIREDHVDEAVYDVIRLALHEDRMERLRDACRDKTTPRASNSQALAAEWSARLEPISRSEDADTAEALRELRRDLKAWERCDPEA